MARGNSQVVIANNSQKVLSIVTDPEDPKMVQVTMSKRAWAGTLLGVFGTVAMLVISATRG